MKVYTDEKPENCDVCPCESEIWCNITCEKVGSRNSREQRPVDCPLESIAEHDKEKDRRIAVLERAYKRVCQLLIKDDGTQTMRLINEKVTIHNSKEAENFFINLAEKEIK